ncbi:MAG: RNA polymerase sigma factor [Caldilineaceae bacterium]|nr:RNA polymerase sigma factor [Caldilineaceae bacterium]
MYATYAPQMYRLCHSLVGNSEDAKDSLQLAFVQAFRSIHRFDHTSQISTWLHGIVVRVAANQRRSKRRWWRLRVAYDSDKRHLGKTRRPGPEARIAGRELLGLLDGALDKLPEKKRTAFILYYVQQHSIQEVANLTDASLQTTRARILSARDKLQKLCRQQHWEEP